MKTSEFMRWLKARGVKVRQGKKHYRIERPGCPIQTVPRHFSDEMNERIRLDIIRDLRLKK